MRFVRYDDSRLGLVSDDGNGIIDLTDRLELSSDDPLQEYLKSGRGAWEFEDETPDHTIDAVSIDAPVRRPGKVIAAAGNYVDHIGELSDEYVHPDQRTIEEKTEYFLKAPSSIVGPESNIELPFSDRRCDPEPELAFIIGEDMKDVSPEEAWEGIFGYTLLLDITVRGKENRSNRKSFDTFTPMSPQVVTSAEIGDPHDLDFELEVNGETRQAANTGMMIHTCAQIASFASVGMTLEAGDVISTGTPSGINPIHGGDVVHVSMEKIGELELDVTERDDEFAGLDIS